MKCSCQSLLLSLLLTIAAIAQNLDPCPSDEGFEGHLTTESFLAQLDVASDDEVSEFRICPGHEYDTLVLPRLNQRAISITCASTDKNCVLNNSNTHIIIDGEGDMVLTVDGVMFSNASNTSVAVSTSSRDAAAAIHFYDCRWEGNQGRSIISIRSNETEVNATMMNGTDQSLSGFSSSTSAEPSNISLTWKNCAFVDNTPEGSVILNEAASSLYLERTHFFDNRAGESILSLQEGEAKLENVSFLNSEVAAGVVFVGDDAMLLQNESYYCGIDNIAQTFCNGTLHETLGAACKNESGCVPQCQRIPEVCEIGGIFANEREDEQQNTAIPGTKTCPLNGDVQGHLTVEDFLSQVGENVGNTLSTGTLVVCPGRFNESLEISSDLGLQSVIVVCADEATGCIWETDSSHIIIDGETSLNVTALTFTGAVNSTSIQVTAKAASATAHIGFDNCKWTKNQGPNLISIDFLLERRRLQDLEAYSNVTVTLTNSSFSENAADGSLVSNKGASVMTFESCSFELNSAGRSVIGLSVGERHRITNTVFVGNNVTNGVVTVADKAKLSQESVCGSDNQADANSCNGTYLEVADVDNCQNPDDLACFSVCLDFNMTCGTEGQQSKNETEGSENELNSGGSQFHTGNETLSPCPGNTDVLGHLSTRDFLDEMESVQAHENSTQSNLTFYQCPGQAYQPFLVPSSEGHILIVCADSGMNCVWESQTPHLIVDGENDVVLTVVGITFSGATDSSSVVIAASTPEAAAVVNFRHCAFVNNQGQHVVLVNYTGGVLVDSGARMLGVNPGGSALSNIVLSFASVSFEGNTVSQSLITNNAASAVYVHGSKFSDNIAGRFVLEMQVGESHELVDSSFKNQFVQTGLVFVGGEAKISQSGICGFNNTSGGSNQAGGEPTGTEPPNGDRPPNSGPPNGGGSGNGGRPPNNGGGGGGPPNNGGGGPISVSDYGCSATVQFEGTPSSSPRAAALLGDVGCVDLEAQQLRNTATYPIEQDQDATHIYGPMEAGFTSSVPGMSCLGDRTVSGGIDTNTAELIVQYLCPGETIEVLDACGGHAIPYHYHERMSCLYTSDAETGHSTRIGTAGDGNGIYGKYIDGGVVPTDLDACGGRFGVTPDSGGEIVYYYPITSAPPFSLGCFGPVSSVEECRELYPDTCGDAATIEEITTMYGTGMYALNCPCFDADHSNVEAQGRPAYLAPVNGGGRDLYAASQNETNGPRRQLSGSQTRQSEPGEQSPCNGTLVQAANADNCQDPNDLNCSSTCIAWEECADNECFASWDELRIALASGGNVSICDDTIVTLEDTDEPISIDEFDVSLHCHNCTISGGFEQFKVTDGVSRATFEGLTFASSIRASVVVDVDPLEPSDVQFHRCNWFRHTGEGVILIGSNGGTTVNRFLADTFVDPVEASVVFSSALFEENSVTNHVISNGGVRLLMEDLTITNNVARDENDTTPNSMIATFGGETVLDGVRFEGNQFSGSAVYVSKDSQDFSTSSICGTNNFGDTCNGTLFEGNSSTDCGGAGVCNGQCISYSNCSANESCYSSYKDLSRGLELAEIDETEFMICPFTTLQLDETQDEIVVDKAGVVIKCGEDGSRQDSCIISGGKQHFKISSEHLEFRGITFQKSSMVSVEIIAGDGLERGAAFYDCEWSFNTGSEAVLVSTGTTNRNLQQVAEITGATGPSTNFSNSYFVNNTVLSSVVKNSATNLLFVDTKFEGNVAGKSVLETLHGDNYLFDTEFLLNEVQEGILYVGFGASLAGDITNAALCGLNNTVVQTECTGVFVEIVESDRCTDDPLTSCASCQTIPNCETPPGGCYSEYEKLLPDMYFSEGNKEFVVCPGTDFRLGSDDPPLGIASSDVTLKCGSSGMRSNGCTMSGGTVQLFINGSVTGVRVEGMTFVGSTEVSIAAVGDKESNATVHDCHFSDHTGSGVILVYNAANEPGVPGRYLQSSQDGRSMHLEINSCSFEDNIVEVACIGNIAGSVEITQSEFSGNSGEVGAIISSLDSNLSVTESCFSGNYGNVSGSILVQESQLLEQTNNFGVDNSAGQGECTDILIVGSSNSLDCTSFDGVECIINAESGTTQPSISPQPSQSRAPTEIPASLSPTRGFPTTAVPTAKEPCFDEWVAFSGAVRDSQDGDSLVVCAGTRFDLDADANKEFVPLQIPSNDVSIRCASRRQDSCVMAGGNTQMRVTGSVTGLTVTGVTFMGALGTSVHADVSAPFSMEFAECSWKNNSGSATIDIINRKGGVKNRRSLSGANFTTRSLQDEVNDTNDFVCDQCLFDSNKANDGIITAVGVSVYFDHADFRDNEVERSLISAESSALEIADSCVTGTGLPSDGSLINSTNSQIKAEGSYLSGNGGGGTGCDGVVDDQGGCTPLDAADSCSAAAQRCHADLESMLGALSRSQGAVRIITICENSIIDLDGQPPVELSNGNTHIRCGTRASHRNSCFIRGGEVQFLVTNLSGSVVLQGLTFSRSSVASIHAAGGEGAKLDIIDCQFHQVEFSQASVLVYRGDIPSQTVNRRRLAITDFNEPDERSMMVEVMYSSFLDVGAELAPIACLKCNVIVKSSRFEGNSGQAGGIGVWFDGSLDLEQSCFRSNSGVLAGSAYFNGDTISETDNWSDSNEVSSGECLDLSLATGCAIDDPGCNTVCVTFSAETCVAMPPPTLAPIESPTVTAEGCYQDWDDLRQGIETINAPDGAESVLALCPSATLVVGEEPIIIDQMKNVSIECSPSDHDSCVISGGTTQFLMRGSGLTVSFRGITFTNSLGVSILALADESSQARFYGCHWTENKGAAAILVYNEAAGEAYDSSKTLEDLLTPASQSMLVDFQDCEFRSNRVLYSVVANIFGRTNFRAVLFAGHVSLRTGAVAARAQAEVGLQDSCFVENESMLPGTIFLGNQSKLLTGSNLYGSNNGVSMGDCTDIFTLAEPECTTDSCGGFCTSFDAPNCSLPAFNPTPPPSPVGDQSPTLKPTESLKLQEESLFSSNFFFRNLVTAAIVLAVGVGAFLFCKRQQKGGSKAKVVNQDFEEADPEALEGFEEERGPDDDGEYEGPTPETRRTSDYFGADYSGRTKGGSDEDEDNARVGDSTNLQPPRFNEDYDDDEGRSQFEDDGSSSGHMQLT